MFGRKLIAGLARPISAIALSVLVSATLFPVGAVAAQGSVASPASTASDAAPVVQKISVSVVDYLNSGIASVHSQIVQLAGAVPSLPGEFEEAARRIVAIDWQRGVWRFVVFVLVVAGSEWLIRTTATRMRRRLDSLPDETVTDRLRLIVSRFGLRLATIVGFAIASIVPFLLLDLPPIRRALILGLIIAVVIIRLTAALGDLLLAPDRENLRSIPMGTAAARFWQRRLMALATWFAIGWVIVQECLTLGFSEAGVQVVGYTLGLGVIAIALEAIWRSPAGPAGADASAFETRQFSRTARNTGLSAGIALLWVLWVAAPGVTNVRPSFWLVLVIMALPLAIHMSQQAVDHLFRSSDASETAPSVIRVGLEHGIRALLILGAVAVLSYGWDVDLIHLAGRDTFFARVVRGALTTVVILLLADVLWQILKGVIDGKLARTVDLGQPNSEEARRRARLHTLLPIFRNVSLIVVVVVATMMALAELGIQIGPLIAGASVIGVAIGFGAQTFVRDIIAGMFYLVDDAFRVGEYIQSGNYKGTVEGFSIRSVRLRHHRGPVYTVPFSLLGAIQNQSRDWVIDKLTVGITYDSDLERARKLIKQIGQDLAQDPEYAPLIIEPLKMQGVEELGDFAIKIRLKMMTLPGEQFVIRRKAYAMIKKAFDENGIKFAFPTVQVAGEVEPQAAAAAKQSLELTRPAAE
jgi:moderate conductance mechanosensitive channel